MSPSGEVDTCHTVKFCPIGRVSRSQGLCGAPKEQVWRVSTRHSKMHMIPNHRLKGTLASPQATYLSNHTVPGNKNMTVACCPFFHLPMPNARLLMREESMIILSWLTWHTRRCGGIASAKTFLYTPSAGPAS